VLFEEDEYVINVGPQHPATHGAARLPGAEPLKAFLYENAIQGLEL